ncbi:xanthine dehydrogenase family protein subunit M [Nocardioides anomalus]|uniref:Xanthine dehydrogenase family protein subunit M n=1 Tax=Nocardioides anomalus TaxID=2712223 RepID=A0A6G6WIL2_9ACTN|nr:FAD binding domain-containing protein [Nocardioides anomalus]QIG45168.1 xanthine dehydrogenase family protein subunit M [Nocardioides anomalus]
MRYYRPESTADALRALATSPASSRVLVGGTDLLVALRHRTVVPDLVVDIKAARDLREPIRADDAGVTFGPTATMAQVATHPVVQEWFPALVEAALLVGSVAIRTRASLIANSANGSPAADTSPPLLGLGAEVTIASTEGERTVPLRDFFLASRRTLCEPGELVTALRVPRPAAGSASAYLRMTRRRGVDLATCSVAAVVEADGSVTAGLGAVGPTALLGGPTGPLDLGSAEELEHALDTLLEHATPIGDVRAGRPYRAAMLRVLAKRAVLRAAGRRAGADDQGRSVQ